MIRHTDSVGGSPSPGKQGGFDGSVEGVAVVVMAKPAVPGRVKTRLIGAGIDAAGAAAIYQVMAQCVLDRVRAVFSSTRDDVALILAMDPVSVHAAAEAEGSSESRVIQSHGWRTIPQGGGTLGQRMLRVWRSVVPRAVVFLGTDSPDVPAEALVSVRSALDRAQVAIGPVGDGGYWTLASRVWAPELLQGIDWGGLSVYDQTVEAARKGGLSVAPLMRWHDVDRPCDLEALWQRLGRTTDPDLRSLRRRLGPLCPGLSSCLEEKG